MLVRIQTYTIGRWKAVAESYVETGLIDRHQQAAFAIVQENKASIP